MKKNILIVIALSLLVLGLWLNWPYLLTIFGPATMGDRGLFGDSYGSLNTLFTGLAFIGVAVSIAIQSRESAKRDKEKTEESIEARFFHLNDSFRLVVSGMESRLERLNLSSRTIRTVETVRTGKDVFEIFVRHLDQIVAQKLAIEQKPELQMQIALDAYYATHKEYEDDLGPYFRMLYRIFKYIDRAGAANKEEYAKIVRAELSGSELIIIAINGLTEYGEKFKPLIIKYDLMKHYPGHAAIPKSVLIHGYEKKVTNPDSCGSTRQ
jgi:hypothetical protein